MTDHIASNSCISFCQALKVSLTLTVYYVMASACFGGSSGSSDSNFSSGNINNNNNR
jgi:hypothetical protein